MGMYINGAQNLLVYGLAISEFWGDGIYITGYARNVVIKNVVSAHNRRQGMSIIHCNGILVADCVFKNTDGTDPMAGIDVEPNQHQNATNVRITGCEFFNNTGPGLAFGNAQPAATRNLVFVGNITVDCSVFHDNGKEAITAPYNQLFNPA